MADEEKKKHESTMTEEEKSKCHKIIHTAAGSAAAIGFGLAQIPGSDAIPITTIQIGMIVGLGAVFGTEVTEAAAKAILGGAAAAIGGRTVSQFLVGWIPVLGNPINAATAFTITEGIGWYVADDFADDAKKRDEKIRRLEKERKEEEARIREQERKEAEARRLEQERREAEIRRLEQEREEAEARKQSIVQMLMYFVVSALLAAMCGLDCFVLNYLKVSSLLANIFSGILIVLIVDALIYSMHLKNIMPMKSAGQLIFSSNFIAAVINIAGSLIYLAYDAKVREIIGFCQVNCV